MAPAPRNQSKLDWLSNRSIVRGLVALLTTAITTTAGTAIWRVRIDVARTADQSAATRKYVDEQMVPRDEHKQRWKLEDQIRSDQIANENRRFDELTQRMDHRMDDLKNDIRELGRNPRVASNAP